MTSFEWTAPKEQAVRLMAEGRTTVTDIAAQVGVSHDTVSRWRKHAEFQQRLKELSQEMAGDLSTFVNASRRETMERAEEVVAGYWEVADNDHNMQARVTALNQLAKIAGLLGRGGAAMQGRVDVAAQGAGDAEVFVSVVFPDADS